MRTLGISALAFIALTTVGQACGGGSSSTGMIQAEAGVGGETSSSGSSGGSGSSSGSSSGGSTSGGSGSSGGSSTSGGTDAASGSCLGSTVLEALGKHRLLIGVSTNDAPTAAAAPFDLRYVYISG